MKADPCDTCVLKSTFYCLDCFEAGTGGRNNNWRPKTQGNLPQVRKLKEEGKV